MTFTLNCTYFLHSQQQQVDTRQTLVVDDKTLQTFDEQQTFQTTEVDTNKETNITDKKKSLKDTMKEKAKKLKKFIETKSSHKKPKDVRI